jgi:mRNA interferase RelE/StbE
MTDTRRYRVEIERSVGKSFRRLPKDLLRRLLAAVHALADEPRPPGSRKLVGYDNLYRVRVGDWRIIYQIYDDKLIVLVIEVGPRASIYRRL